MRPLSSARPVMTLHILYASLGYKPANRLGGPIISVVATAESLVRKGHSVTVFTTNSNLDEELDVPLDQPVEVQGVQVWYFRREEFIKRWLPFISYLSRSVGYLYAPQMSRQLQHEVPRVDLVHTQIPFVYPTYAAAQAARRFCKPLFYHQRGVFDPERLKFRSLKKRLYINFIECPIMRQATTLLALTEAEVESYRALGVQTPCRVVPNGIETTAYRTQPSPDFDARWGLPPDALLILFLGRLHPIKGAGRLLEAFLRLQARIPQAVLVLAGPDEWGLEAKFRERIQAADLERRVFFPGMVSGNDKLDLLARADVFCLPSDAEGFSMAVLEALASATPVLLSPGCHFPEVESAGAGWVVPHEPEALAIALADLLADPGKLRAMGCRGREWVAQHYSWDRITDQLLDVYHEGLERNKLA